MHAGGETKVIGWPVGLSTRVCDTDVASVPREIGDRAALMAKNR